MGRHGGNPIVNKSEDEAYNYDKVYWSLFAFALILMTAGILIEAFYYYIPRTESARAGAAESIGKTRKDLAYALAAVNALPKGVVENEKDDIERSKVFLANAEYMFEAGGYLNPDVYAKAENQAESADTAFMRIVRNSSALGHARDSVMTAVGTDRILSAVADYCEELESAYPKAEVPEEISGRASEELLSSAGSYCMKLRTILENNKAWERDLTANQNTAVDLMETGSEDTDFLDRMTTVCRKTKQRDAMVKVFYQLFKASREGELYGRVKVRPDVATNLLDYWASDLNKVSEHNTSMEADLVEAENTLLFARAE